MKNETGIAKIASIGLTILLVTGVLGSVVMNARSRSAALEDTVTQAGAIADGSLGLVFRPEDLDAVASDARTDILTDQIGTVVIDPSDFETVTLWSPNAEILYATEEGRIGNRLEGERDRIRAALRGNPQTRVAGGIVSVMLPLRFASGVGGPAAVELTTSDQPVAAAGDPWKTMAVFCGVALVFVVGLMMWVLRHASSPELRKESRVTQRLVPLGAQSAASAPRTISVPAPGMKEEGDARRKAEDRARAAEQRLGVIQDQYRKTLDELQAAQNKLRDATNERPDAELEERAMRAEQRVEMLEDHARGAQERARALEDRSRELEDRARLFERRSETAKAELDELTRSLAERPDAGEGDPDERLIAAEQETIGLRAELEGTQTQLSMLRRELHDLRPRAERARELQEELDAIHSDAEQAAASRAELSATSKELGDMRAEIRALRNEEQRAAMLDDELRSTRAELESLTASHRAELVEREAELESKVRSAREEFQEELARVEARHTEELARNDANVGHRIASAEDSVQQRIDGMQRELEERTRRFQNAENEIAMAQAESTHLAGQLGVAQAELEATVAQLTTESRSLAEATDRITRAEQRSRELEASSRRMTMDLEAAAQENADLNRRLQEIEARRQLELAGAEGRADIDEILRVTQERLAGQTEKLITAEERAHALERELQDTALELEEAQGELRQQQMAAAMRQIRGADAEPAAVQQEGSTAGNNGAAIEDRRATSPFLKELSVDARKSLTRILGITQILKHNRDGKEQAQLVRQLSAYTRRLDHIVADLADADRLVHGQIALTIRRTDLEALVKRVTEESGIDADHELRVETERVVVAVDQLRTEQILAGLLRASGDRTPARKAITVRLTAADDGAMIAVDDPEPSSDASMSPVVERFAEAQGGWARVAGRENGGSSFQVYLPDGAGSGSHKRPDRGGATDAATSSDELHIVVDTVETSASADGSALVDELHRLSTAED